MKKKTKGAVPRFLFYGVLSSTTRTFAILEHDEDETRFIERVKGKKEEHGKKVCAMIIRILFYRSISPLS